MSASSVIIERKVLSEAFQEAMAGARLRAAVFLTFRFEPAFFEQDILPVFFDVPMSHAPVVRVLHVEEKLRESGPVAVYYDARALDSGAGARQTQFRVIPVNHRTGYFHPKNVLLLVDPVEKDSTNGASERRLIVGTMSANLSKKGWWENVEVAHIERVEAGEVCSFRDDLLALISLIRRVSSPGADHSALDEVHEFVRKLEQEPRRVADGLLLPRLFAGDRDLPEFLDEVAGSRLRRWCLEVISPYFDEQESAKPLTEIMERYRPLETRVFLPRRDDGTALCSDRYWQALRDLGVEWGCLPTDVVRLTRDADRFVHAKVYRFFDPDGRREILFVGSVNLTNAGFGRGGNVESGFLVERENRRRCDWWLEIDEKKPATFVEQNETEEVAVGLGIKLVLRYDWTTNTVHAFWDAAEPSPALTIAGAGVRLGAIGSLPSRELTPLSGDFADRIRQHLVSSSFVTVMVEGMPDATILVDEEGTVDKPSLLATLSPEDILRFWSLLTDEQKQEFFEEHIGVLDDEEAAIWNVRPPNRPPADGMFGTFAHVYLSFGNLERAVRRALTEGRRREAVDRLFGQKFDSVRRLVSRIAEKEQPEPVRDYVTLLCAIQLLTVLRREDAEFYRSEQKRFALIDEARAVLERLKSQLSFGEEEERREFFDWFEKWFLRRATPVKQEQPV